MAYAFVQSATGVSVAGTLNTATTTSASFTGANTLFLMLAQFETATVPTITDNVGGNTWNLVVSSGYPSGSMVRLFRCASANVSGSMTVTATQGTDAAFGLVLLGFSGGHASPDDQSDSEVLSLVQSMNAAHSDITPSFNDCVIIAGMNIGGGQSIDDGFTIVQADGVANESWGTVAAYLIQTTAVAVNPTFTWSFDFNAASLLASFRGDPTVTARRLILSTPLA